MPDAFTVAISLYHFPDKKIELWIMLWEVNGLNESAFHVDRTIPDHRRISEFTEKSLKEGRFIDTPAGDQSAIIGFFDEIDEIGRAHV